jgi:Na+-translocating ferredoxin:NAD+ oxidoreductase RnfC subunit
MAEITVQHVADAGVVGAGGAGFPTHVKLAGRADAVLLNAAECEPLLHKDKEILQRHPEAVLEGLQTAMRLVGANRGRIGIKNKYHHLLDMLGPLLPTNVDVAPLQDTYPAGDEFILVYDLLGRVIPPGGIPLAVGALVLNVETALNVARSHTEPVTEKYLTIAGAVAEPVTLRVPLGVTLRQCVEAAGGAAVPDPHYVVGGVMMGRLANDLDALVDKTTGGIVVLPSAHPAVRRRQADWSQIARIGRSACDQCSFCTELCPRYLLGHPIEPHRAMRSLGFNLVGAADVLGTAFCCECNLCSMYSCPEDLDPKSVCGENKRRLLAEKHRWEDPPFNPRRPELHLDNRRAPMARLMQKLGLLSYRNAGPLRDELLPAQRVGIRLKQHVGAPCQPVVSVGERVAKGAVVGKPPVNAGNPALGAPVHASIAGTVTAIDANTIWIEE